MDKLADLMFTAATDVEAELPVESAEVPRASIDASTLTTHDMTDARLLQLKRDEIVDAVGRKLGAKLVRKSRALYQSADHEKRIACTISKRYNSGSTYWYAYHPKWDDFLKDGSEGLFVLGCMDLDKAFALPRSKIASLLDSLHISENDRGRYWHIHISERDQGDFELVLPKKRNLSLRQFELSLHPH